jgi:xanthine dehydrogenase large subunit
MAPEKSNSVGKPLPHESAELHVTGEARYTDDIPEPIGTLHAAIGVSEVPHARIRSIDLDAVRRAPGVVAVATADDVPGVNDISGHQLGDDPIFADGLVEYIGHSIFAVAATSVELARRAAKLAKIEYEELEPILDVDTALERQSFVLPTVKVDRGDAARAIAGAAHRLSGQVRLGGQDQFYLEGHIAFALPREHGDMLVYSSTQHPGEVQLVVARALDRDQKDVVVECRRMGGGFGGKETQPALFASIAAILAQMTDRPVKVRLDRDADMTMTGKRHGYRIDYEVGYDEEGEIKGLDITYAFRGFGGPQGMFGIEYVVDEIARHLGLDPLDVRKKNFYGIGERDVTPYQMTVEDNVLHELVPRLEESSEYRRRRQEIDDYNADSRYIKRGIALTPVKFGISFTATHYNQAGALVHVYTDGTVLLNHGGTEMGQGLFTKVAQVVAHELGIDIADIRCTASDTSKVPNASATAASSGSDLNGMAAKAAAATLRGRLAEFAAESRGVDPEAVRFEDGKVHIGDEEVSFAELAHEAYIARVSLSASGFYRTPKIHYDRATMTGRPFYYFAYGAACSEVAIDLLTGESRVLRVDILHDVGESLNPAIDTGQVEGGFIQGMGWLTTEELWWDPRGALQTHAPSTYKIPVASNLPEIFNVELLPTGRNNEPTIHRSKAVGEPPLMLAISVFHAIKDAVASVSEHRLSPGLDAPATPEEILEALEDLYRRMAEESDRAESGAAGSGT